MQVILVEFSNSFLGDDRFRWDTGRVLHPLLFATLPCSSTANLVLALFGRIQDAIRIRQLQQPSGLHLCNLR